MRISSGFPREKELLEREEAHVDQLRQKDAHYSSLVSQLKERIEELEKRLEEMAQRFVTIHSKCLIFGYDGNISNKELLTCRSLYGSLSEILHLHISASKYQFERGF